MTDSGKRRPLRSYIKEIGSGKKSKRLGVRLSEDHWEGLEQEARDEGMSVSTFIRRMIELRIGRRLRRKKQPAQSDVEPPSSKGRT